jgi:hypothetical protein
MEDVIQSQDLSFPLLASLFERAYMEVESDPEEPYLLVRERYPVVISMDGRRDWLHFRIRLRCDEQSERMDRLRFANRVNREFILLSASDLGDSFAFDHSMLVEGGVTAKNVVLCLRRFAACVKAAADTDTQGLMP